LIWQNGIVCVDGLWIQKFFQNQKKNEKNEKNKFIFFKIQISGNNENNFRKTFIFWIFFEKNIVFSFFFEKRIFEKSL
jgi:hypothetical protein